MDYIDVIMKAETVGLDTEEELIDYTVALITTGLACSTGSNQRFVAEVLDSELADQVLARL